MKQQKLFGENRIYLGKVGTKMGMITLEVQTFPTPIIFSTAPKVTKILREGLLITKVFTLSASTVTP